MSAISQVVRISAEPLIGGEPLRGTGFVVQGKKLVTAFHVLYDLKDGEPRPRREVVTLTYFGLDRGRATYALHSSPLDLTPQSIHAQDPVADWIVVNLGAVPDFAHEWACASLPRGRDAERLYQFGSYGFPRDDGKALNGTIESTQANHRGRWVYQLSSDSVVDGEHVPGYSGGPVVVNDEVVAVVLRADVTPDKKLAGRSFYACPIDVVAVPKQAPQTTTSTGHPLDLASVIPHAGSPMTNIPTGPRLIGRDAIQASLRHALSDSRVVTLVGAVGCGVNTIARSVALDLFVRDVVGQAWAAQCRHNRLPENAIAEVILPGELGTPPISGIVKVLGRTASSLVVIHDPPPAALASTTPSGKWLAKLMDRAPGLRLVITQQGQSDGHFSGSVVRVPPLTVPESWLLLREFAGPMDRDAASLASAVAKLDGSAWALRMFAYAIKRTSGGFPSLRSDLPPIEAARYAVLNTLDPRTQDVYQAASLAYAAEFTREDAAAAAEVDGSTAARAIAELVDANLVSARRHLLLQSDVYRVVGASGRALMLPGDHGAVALASAAGTAARNHVADLARANAPFGLPPHQIRQLARLDLLGDEVSVVAGGTGIAAARCSLGEMARLSSRGSYLRATRVANDALEKCATEDVALQACIMLGSADAHTRARAPKEALECLDQMESILLNQPNDQAWRLISSIGSRVRGNALVLLERRHEAIESFERSANTLPVTEFYHRTSAELGLATAYGGINDQTRALEHAERALNLCPEDTWLRGVAHLVKGNILVDDPSRHQEAAQQYEQAIAGIERIGRFALRALPLLNLGVVHFVTGNLELAGPWFEQARIVFAEQAERPPNAILVDLNIAELSLEIAVVDGDRSRLPAVGAQLDQVIKDYTHSKNVMEREKALALSLALRSVVHACLHERLQADKCWEDSLRCRASMPGCCELAAVEDRMPPPDTAHPEAHDAIIARRIVGRIRVSGWLQR